MALFINNARWDGVPFLLKAGKALANRRTEIRVQFRNVPGNLFSDRLSLNGMDLDRSTNELVCCCACWASYAESTHAGPSSHADKLECSQSTCPHQLAEEDNQDNLSTVATVILHLNLHVTPVVAA